METRVLIPSSLTLTGLEQTDPSSSQKCSKHYKTRVQIKKEPVEDPTEADSSPQSPSKVTQSRHVVDEEEDTEVAGSSSEDDNSNETGFSRNESPEIRVVTKYFVPKGTLFHPNEGGIIGLPPLKEDSIPPITPHDIRLIFGCVDRLVLESGVSLRLCNWLRFLPTPPPTTPHPQSESCPNLVGAFSLSTGQVTFTTTKDLSPGTQLIPTFDISSLASLHSHTHNSTPPPKETPLDLTTPTNPTTTPDKLRKVFTHPHHHHPLSPDEDKSDPDWSQRSRSTRGQGRGRGRGQYQPEPSASSSTLLSLRQKLIPFSISAVLGQDLSGSGSSSSGAGGLCRPGGILRTRGRERSLLPCDVCGKAFDRPSLLKRHTRTHTGEKPHVCDVCGKGFSTSSSLNTHRRIHSGEKPHQCGVCGKRFTASSNLYYHRMTHNKEKPHKCVLCGKSFPTPGDLKSHAYVHSGSWPYNCPICHRGFSKQTNLRNHLLLHSGDKPHNCHLCSKKFALACNLRAHLRTHEEEEEAAAKGGGATPVGGVVQITTTPPLPRVQSSVETKLLPPPGPPHFTSHLPLGAFSPYGYTHMAPTTPTNPFLEQLFQWNYRFAKETAGSLSMMQQKLLESQMLAAHLMIGGGPGPPSSQRLLPLVPFSVEELLRATSYRGPSSSSSTSLTPDTAAQLFPTDLNKFLQ